MGIANNEGKIFANERDMYLPKPGWGIIPMEAAEHHKNVKEAILRKALEKAKMKIEDIGVIAYSRGPGMPPCLHKGAEFAKELSDKYKKPIVGVNHLIAHIEIGRLTSGFQGPIVTFTSGANTQVISFASGRYRVFGECMDIGIGNALDKFGRAMGLDFPQAPKIEQLAKGGKWIDLPYVVKGMDLSFSGIVTESIKKHSQGAKLEDVCYSIQEVFFSMLTEVTERALAHLGKDQVLLTGGVAANQRLQAILDTMCRERKAKFSVVPKEFSGDNGAMIAWTGALIHKSGHSGQASEAIDIDPRWRTDDVEIGWL